MTFDLRAIFIFSLAAVPFSLLAPRFRSWALFIGSLLAIYWLQPPLPIRFSDFILPTFTLLLVLAVWWAVRLPPDALDRRLSREDWLALVLLGITVFALSLNRYLDASYRLTPSRPPDPLHLGASTAIIVLLFWFGREVTRRLLAVKTYARLTRGLLIALILLLILLLVFTRTSPLAEIISSYWRGLTGQDAALASPVDINWLGFSYVAFRLIHVLRDRQSGLLPALSLREFVIYVLFFASYTAGPIDRAERFVADLRLVPTLPGPDAARFTEGVSRILLGLLKKFVIADSLAGGASLTPDLAAQSAPGLALWFLLYGYALRLYLDFSGYTDIAIGLGILFGIRLPENFNRPYLKSSITAFWQSWHMTLSGWARFYVFSPLSRGLLGRERRPSSAVILLISHLATMIVIGLWHGVTVNFFIWGVWQAVGLYLHRQWSDRTRRWYRELGAHTRRKQLWTLFGWFFTFHYVVLGWVWFALPEPALSLRVFAGLLGAG